MLKCALDDVIAESRSYEIFVVVFLHIGQHNRSQASEKATRTSNEWTSHGGGGEDLSDDRIVSKAVLLYL